jgi:glutamine synthetase
VNLSSTTPPAGRLRVLWPDHLGLARGKYLPSRSHHTSTNHCVGVFSQHYDRRVSYAPSSGFEEGFPDLEARFDPGQARPGWEESTDVVIADLYRDGEPLEIAPRRALARAVEAWRSLGYDVDVGIELEAFVLEPDGKGGWRPWDTPGGFVYGTGPLADPAGLFDEIMATAERSGLGVESVTCESDVPQFELALEHGDAVDAVDRAFLARLMAREVATRRGLLLTFMGRPFADRPGSGMHVNFSLHGDGANALGDERAADGLSELCRGAIAGLVAHHVGMTALCAPTVNAYKRLRPGMLSGYWANWGYDHRVATTRVPPHRGAGTHVEHRMSDGAANPYLATAAILHAARLGVTGRLPLPAPERALEPDPDLARCPADLASAIDALESDGDLVAALGPELVANFAAIKRTEWQRFTDAVTDWELSQYLWFC